MFFLTVWWFLISDVFLLASKRRPPHILLLSHLQSLLDSFVFVCEMLLSLPLFIMFPVFLNIVFIMIASLHCFEMALRAIPSVTLKNSSFSRLNTHVSLSEVRNTSRQPTWERPCCPVRRADCGVYWTTGSGRPGWAAWRCLAGCGSGYCHWCAAPWGGWVSTMSCSGSSPALHPNTDIKSNIRTKAQCGWDEKS